MPPRRIIRDGRWTSRKTLSHGWPGWEGKPSACPQRSLCSGWLPWAATSPRAYPGSALPTRRRSLWTRQAA
eukprot:scaffold682074_cov34-Prasinocladus_malaysianus.AAC.1